PYDAVKIHLDVKTKFSVGIHWGTFNLGKEFFLDPIYRLDEAKYCKRVNVNSFNVLAHGETIVIK
ncbi:hypothetical protein B4U79_10266, partial [Dinothrombium tinctorium]